MILVFVGLLAAFFMFGSWLNSGNMNRPPMTLSPEGASRLLHFNACRDLDIQTGHFRYQFEMVRKSGGEPDQELVHIDALMQKYVRVRCELKKE